jgi:hypothetical protein
MSMAATMPHPKPKGPDAGGGRTGQVRIVVSAEFKEWLERYAESRQLTMTDTIVQDLIRGAKEQGFEPPPKR